MKKFTRFIAVAIMMALCLVSFVSVPSTLAYIVKSDGPVTNTFRPGYDPVTDTVFTSITAHKTVENIGEVGIGPDGFTFILEDIHTAQSFSAVSSDKGLAVFPLTFGEDQIGLHSYQLYELKEERGGVTYSDQVYNVEIEVRREGSVLVADVMLNEYPTTIAPFRNVYNSKEDPAVPETGVDAPVVYAAMLAAGVIGLVALLRKRRSA